MDPITAFSYTSTTPKGYECHRCRESGVKLWREYNTFVDHQRLLCIECVKIEKADRIARLIDTWKSLKVDPPETDQIGGMVPAVPTEDGTSFWGYTSVPQAGVEWWKNLPLNK